ADVMPPRGGGCLRTGWQANWTRAGLLRSLLRRRHRLRRLRRCRREGRGGAEKVVAHTHSDAYLYPQTAAVLGQIGASCRFLRLPAPLLLQELAVFARVNPAANLSSAVESFLDFPAPTEPIELPTMEVTGFERLAAAIAAGGFGEDGGSDFGLGRQPQHT